MRKGKEQPILTTNGMQIPEEAIERIARCVRGGNARLPRGAQRMQHPRLTRRTKGREGNPSGLNARFAANRFFGGGFLIPSPCLRANPPAGGAAFQRPI